MAVGASDAAASRGAAEADALVEILRPSGACAEGVGERERNL